MNPWIPHLLRAGGGGGPVLPPTGLTMLANLTSSLILDEGTGGPTWSRATKAWGFNELGYLEELASGCAFFGGARRVRNNITSTANPSWTYQAGGNLAVVNNNVLGIDGAMSGHTLTKTVGTSNWASTTGPNIGAGRSILVSVWLKGSVGGETCKLSDGWSVGPSFTITTNWVQYKWIRSVSDGSNPFSLYLIDSSGIIYLCNPQVNDVTNYDASYIPEYVSVGVEASPYFGAGIDGAKYFETDWQGAPIAAANLLGFRREASAINNLLHSRDLSNAAWSTKTNITAAKTATGLDGLANTATTLTATAADAIILQPISLASAARCASAYVKRRTGSGTISFTQDGGSTWTDITAQINGSTWSRVEITSTLADPSVGFKISTSGDAIDVDCVQNEAGAVATSPIVTTTSTVSRNGDSLTYQTASNIDFAVGTVYCEAILYGSSLTRIPIRVGVDGWSYIHASDANTVWKVYDGTNVVTKSGLSDISTAKRKRVVSWGTGLKVTGDGLAPASGSFDGAFGSGATIEIVNSCNGYIGPVAIYNYQMTDAELQAITA